MTINDLSPSAKTWLQARAEEESQRIQSHGTKCLILPINNFTTTLTHDTSDGGVVKKAYVLNRIEIQTQLDFDRVIELMVGESIGYPYQEGWAYVNIILFTDAPLPMLVPYIYNQEGQVQNDLSHWEFVNAQGMVSRQLIPAFGTIN
jgi:hypothetical protein